VPDAPVHTHGGAVGLHVDFWDRPELIVVGPDDDAEALVRSYAARYGAHAMSVPYAVAGRLEDLGLHAGTPWTFRATTTPPPAPAEPVGWLPPAAEDEVRALLDEAFPDASLPVGHRDVRRWAGLRRDGRLVACAADATGDAPPGETVGFVASIASHPGVRGTGAGAAVTAWVTAALLAEHPSCALWHMGDNPAASLYERLGYRDVRPMCGVGENQP
jgi:hypothetical protein